MSACLVAVACLLNLAICGRVTGADAAPPRVYLIGNSLTWDTVPPRMSGDVQWHVDCGVSLPAIFSKPENPCVKESTIWTKALQEKQYDVISVQPFYGATLAQDVQTISHWMKLQPKAVFVVHSGWAWHEKRADEFAAYTAPDQMTHGPVYLRALVAELKRLHPGREIRQTLAQNLLAQIDEDIAAGRAPLKQVAELYRDGIHMTHDHGKYLMHNAMRRALGQPHSTAGFEKLDPQLKTYLDGVLALLDSPANDRKLLRQILSLNESSSRSMLAARIADAAMRERATALLPRIEAATKQRVATLALEREVQKVGGRLICTPSAPQWVYLATGDEGAELFDVPATIDLYNGNNPLKGKGGRNEQVTDDWLAHVTSTTTLRRLDVSNCAVTGPGLQHIAALTFLREVNLTLTPVNDEGLKHLANMTELRMIGLASTQCTGTGFAHLTKLKHLASVNFHFTPLNDAGLQAIGQVPISDRLWFAHTKFTDAGAPALANLKQLKRCGIGSADKASSGAAVAALVDLPLEDLALLDNQATPDGLAHAAKIATLKKLDASHAPTVTDQSLPAIAQMPKLEEFKLGSAQISDDGLQALAGSKSLKKLSLSGVKNVTPAGIAKLKQAKPELVVESN